MKNEAVMHVRIPFRSWPIHRKTRPTYYARQLLKQLRSDNWSGDWRLELKLGPYSVDIANTRKRAVIECERPHHVHSRALKRAKFIQRLNWRIIWVDNEAIRYSLESVTKLLQTELNRTSVADHELV